MFLKLNVENDRALLTEIEQVLDSWSDEVAGTNHLLTPELLNALVESGDVISEAQGRASREDIENRAQLKVKTSLEEDHLSLLE